MVSYGREYHQIDLHLQIIGGHVLCTATDKDLARNLLHLTLLAVRDLYVAPPPVDHVPLGEHPHLRLVARESDEAEALGLARLDVLLHLRHQHLSERFEVFSQLLLCSTVLDILDKHTALVPVVFSRLWLSVLARALLLLLLLNVSYTTFSIRMPLWKLMTDLPSPSSS